MRVRVRVGGGVAARSTTVHQLLWWGEYAGIENECVPSIVNSCTKSGGLLPPVVPVSPCKEEENRMICNTTIGPTSGWIRLCN